MSSSIPRIPNYDPRTNLCDLLPEPIQIFVIHNGIEIKGHFTFICPSDYTVLIDSPYSGIKVGSHTPYFAMYEENRNVIDGEVTEKCLKAGEWALISAYEEADFLFRNKDVLYQRIIDADQKSKSLIGDLESFQANFHEEKKRLKAAFKAGAIPENEYTSYIKEGKKQIELFNSTVSTIRQNVFSDFPEYQLKYGFEVQDVEFVRKYFYTYSHKNNE
ncbi:MAG: hypothetical protein WCT14_03505 [Treponemataceae bacterium]